VGILYLKTSVEFKPLKQVLIKKGQLWIGLLFLGEIFIISLTVLHQFRRK